jgi:hypothetical protein
VAIPIGDMFERGELTNVLEDRNVFRGNSLVLKKIKNSQELKKLSLSFSEFLKIPQMF